MPASAEIHGQQDEAFDRLMRLQALTASLSEAVTTEQVAEVILAQSAAVLGSNAGVVAGLGDDGVLTCLHVIGYPAEVVESLRQFPLDAPLPLAEAVRKLQPVLLANLAEREARYPNLTRLTGSSVDGALIALPLIVRGKPVGGLGLRFQAERTFPEQDRTFLLTIAGLCGQALERARLYDRERAARERAERAELALRASEERLQTVEIRELKQANEALRKSEERFARFMDHLPGLAWVKDHAGRYVYANDAAATAFRKPRSELYGRTDEEIFPPETAIQFRENDRKALVSGAGVRVIEMLEQNDGVLHHSIVSKFAIPGENGDESLVGGMAIDVTEEMRTRAVLEESEERLRATFEQAAVGIAHIGLDDRWLRVNRKLCDIVGYRPDELLALTFQDITHPGDLEADLAQVQRLLAGEIETYSMEKRYFRKDRSLVWINLTVSLVRTPQGQPKHFISVVEDISEKKQVQDALRESESKYRNLFDNMAEEVHFWQVVRDDNGRIQTWRLVEANTPALRTWGKTLEHIRGKTTDEIFGPGSTEHYRAVVEKIFAEGVPHAFEDYFPNLDKHFSFTSVPLGDYFITTGADITALKKAHIAMRESEERLRLAVEATGVGIFDFDPVTGRQVLNDQAIRILGFPLGTDPTPQTILKAVHSDEREWVRAATVESLDPKGKGRFDLTHRIVRPDGEVRWVAVSGRTTFAGEGRRTAVRSVGTMVDITEREEAERRLRDSQQRELERAAVLETVLNAAPTPIFISYDRECRSMTGNPAAFRAVNTPEGEVVSATAPGDLPRKRTFQEYRDGRPLPPNELPMQIAAREGVEVRGVELSFRFHTGEFRHFYGNAVPLRDSRGEVTGAIAAYVDISHRKEAEQQLKASEQRFRQLAEAMPQIVWVADADGHISYLNQHFSKVTGLTTAEGLAMGRGGAIHPEDLEGLRDQWRTSVRTGSDYHAEFRLRGKYGQYRWQVVRGVPIRDAAGQVVCWYGSSTDIDEPKRLAESLREADRRKDEFLATLAHELRNPLAPLRNGLQIMKLANRNAAAMEKARAMMERQLGQLVLLVDDLLDVSRITRGKLQLRLERIELSSVLQSAVENSLPLIDSSSHQLTMTLPPERIWLNADPMRLAQVFSNLLTNAAKYTDKGGQIWLSAERCGGEVVVSVKDNGIGITADHLPGLFQMFSQVGSALERSQGGLGIGLSLVKGLVEMQGGTVEARSEGLGAGSEFIVRLPVVDAALQPAPLWNGGAG